jgi:hypothetical protein
MPDWTVMFMHSSACRTCCCLLGSQTKCHAVAPYCAQLWLVMACCWCIGVQLLLKL